MRCLIFADETTANDNQDVVWLHALEGISQTQIETIRYNGNSITTLEFNALTDDQKKSCRVAGKIKELIVEQGFTIAYAAPLQIHEDTRWWMKKPDNPDWLINMHDYTEDDFNENWLAPLAE